MSNRNERSRPNQRVWQNEGSYRYYFETAAENIFSGLDAELRPGVFIVAFRIDQESGQPIEFVPEDSFCKPSDLAGLNEKIGQLQQLASARTTATSVSLDGVNREFGRASNALRAGLETVLNALPAAKQTICFCSDLSAVDRFLVGVILTLDRRRHEAFPSVPNALDKVQPYSFNSFLDAVIDRFLAASTSEMRSIDPGRNMPPPNEKAILVDAAKRFAARPVFSAAVSHDYGLFDDLCAIASLPYEGSAVDGQIVMQPKRDAQATVLFQQPVPLKSHRAVRKLVELCSSELCLSSEWSKVYGIIPNKPATLKNELCSVRFLRQHTWEMLYGDMVLMRVTLGEPSLPRTAVPEAFLAEVLRRRFTDIKLSDLCGMILDPFRGPECRSYFKHRGYRYT